MDIFISTSFLSLLTHLSPEVLSLLTFSVACFFILLLFRFYGVYGLFAYLSMAYVAANIQVLQVAQFSFLQEPVALGTMLFATTYLVGDLITEHFGYTTAKKTVGVVILIQLSFTLLMLLNLGFRVIPGSFESQKTYDALTVLFLPAPRLIVASLIAYAISLFMDIWVFQKINEKTKGRFLWLRSILSTTLSSFIDNFIFSVLAWVVLSPSPVDFHTLFFTYILGSYIARLIAALMGTPIMYLSYRLKRKNSSS